MTKPKKRGPAPLKLKIAGNWQDAVKKALTVPNPPKRKHATKKK